MATGIAVKTVLGNTEKTPRNIALVVTRASAMIMVRFLFIIFNDKFV